MTLPPLLAIATQLALAGIMLFGVINLAGLHTWLERKQSAVMQDRIGANRARIFGIRILGLFHPIADAIKMFVKEDFVPENADRLLHTLAPALSVFFALVTFAAIPFGDVLVIGPYEINLQVADVNIGLLYVFGMMSMGIYGVALAGYVSNNNYAFLGGLRASSQMISYEITIGATITGLVMTFGTLSLQDMCRAQGELLWGWIPKWGVLLQPLGFLLFVAAGLAETKRIPYDLPEGESEIIGYFVEYSGMKFGMYFFSDFIETVMIACLTAALFFGGWQVPYLLRDGFHFPWGMIVTLPQLIVAMLQIGAFTVKVLFFCFLFMTVRWTLPRFRYDQLMRLGWKMMFPLSLANLVVTAVVLMVTSRGGAP